MSDTTVAGNLGAAEDRVRAAEREARLARIAAADDLWARAVSRTGLLKSAVAALVVLALVLGVTAIALFTRTPGDDDAGRSQVLSAATDVRTGGIRIWSPATTRRSALARPLLMRTSPLRMMR